MGVENNKYSSGSIKMKHLWVLLIYAAVTIVLFSSFIFSDRMLYGSDTIEAGVMFRNFYGEFVKEHHTMPLWNPYLYGGMPFIDAMHGDTFFPLAALQFILPIQRALGYKLVIMVFFGGVFMYMFLLRFNFSPTLAMFGGLAYMLSGFLVSLVYAGHDGRMYITALLPLILMATVSILRNKSLKSLLFFAFSFSILILANHPQFAYFAMWCVGAYFIYGLVRQFLDKRNSKTIFKPSIIIIGAIIIGLAGSIVQLLPPYIYVNNYSPRAEQSRGYEYAASWSMHQEEALSLILPGFVGTSVGDDDNYWGKNAFRLHSDYPGIIITVLALLAVFYYRRKREIYFFMGLAIFALLYALGDHTPVFKLFYYAVPGVKSFRAPSTIMFLYIFSLVFLAVHGLKLLINPELSARQYKKYLYFLSACAGALAFIALLFTVAAESIFKLWASIFYSGIPDVKSMSFETMGPSLAAETWISAALVGLVALFFHMHRKYQSVSAKAKGSSKKDAKSKTADAPAGFVAAFNNFYYHLSKHGGLTVGAFVILIALISTVDLWRENSKFINVVSLDSYLREDGVTRYLDQQGDNFRIFMFPDTYGNQNYLAYYGTEQVFGYHGNQLKRYDDFTERIMIQSARTPEQFQNVYGDMFYGNKLDLLNVKYVVSPFPLNDYKFQQVYNYANVYLNENKLVLPRARVVYHYEVIEETEKAQRRARSREFDYRNSVVLDKEPGIDSHSDSMAYIEARITNDIINEYDVQVKTDKPGILVLSENYYPAWKATIKEKPVDILLADGNFMAIPVEVGEHTVHIEFDSDYYNYSSLVTRITWLLYLGTAVYFLVINRRQRGKNNERSD